MQNTAPSGMRAFTIVWFGQVISLIGTGMTQFAITIWAWEITGQAMVLAQVGFFAFAPMVILSPVAGAIVDRSNRKLVMMLSDLAAGCVTIALFTLFSLGQLQIWHLYVGGFLVGAFQAFQFPAYSSAIALMIPKSQYGRASGMMSLADSGSRVLAPVFAGALFGVIGLGGIMLIDISTFLVALGALIIIYVPQPQQTEEGRAAQGSLLSESLFGFRYILARPSLFGLQSVFFFINLTASMGITLLAPMILARTGNDELLLGSVEAFGAIGGVIGSIVLSIWGGPKRRVHGVLLGMAASAFLGQTLVGLGQGMIIWSLGLFGSSFFVPLLNGSNQAIWQAKVPPDLQGRVFATRLLIAQISIPAAMFLAGLLADHIFEPAMAEGGSLIPLVGGLVGTGSGAGMALILVITGLLGVLVGLAGYAVPFIRNAEDLLPDHDQDASSTAGATEFAPAD